MMLRNAGRFAACFTAFSRPFSAVFVTSFVTLFACALPLPAWAIWQCAQNGQVVYQNEACPNGKQVASAPPVSPENRAQASARAAQDKARLAKIEAEHKKQAALDAKADALNARNAAKHQRRQQQCQQLALRQKWAEQDAAKADGTRQARLQTKARRAGEKYQLQCGSGKP
jgi:hypothetical protein